MADRPIHERVIAALEGAEREAKASGGRLKPEVEAAMINLCQSLQQEAEELVARANESVERVVFNSYEACKAVCMEMKPPARDAAEAITRRQREILGQTAEDTIQGDMEPLDPGLWGTE